MRNNIVTVLIPVYNEGSRLRKVLKELLKIPDIHEFIIVDDGSSDGCTEFLRKGYQRVRLEKLKQNSGKTNAVRIGLSSVRTQYVLLVDADLKRLRHNEIAAGIKAVRNDQYLAMVMFIRTALGNMASVYTGERIVKTEVLKKSLGVYSNAKSYQLEPAVNQYCLDLNLKVAWLPITASNTFKIEKMHSLLGILETPKTIKEIVDLVGWRNYFRQLTVLKGQRLIS